MSSGFISLLSSFSSIFRMFVCLFSLYFYCLAITNRRCLVIVSDKRVDVFVYVLSPLSFWSLNFIEFIYKAPASKYLWLKDENENDAKCINERELLEYDCGNYVDATKIVKAHQSICCLMLFFIKTPVLWWFYANKFFPMSLKSIGRVAFSRRFNVALIPIHAINHLSI